MRSGLCLVSNELVALQEHSAHPGMCVKQRTPHLLNSSSRKQLLCCRHHFNWWALNPSRQWTLLGVPDTACTCAQVETLDGRQLRVPLDHVLIPGGVKTVVGEGMPITKQPGSKGVLRISWDISFPLH